MAPNTSSALLCDFILGTTSHHGMSVGMFRENTGRIWAGVLPR